MSPSRTSPRCCVRRSGRTSRCARIRPPACGRCAWTEASSSRCCSTWRSTRATRCPTEACYHLRAQRRGGRRPRGAGGWSPGPDHGRRHGLRHARRRGRACVRALLHDQGLGRRHGPRPGHRLRDREGDAAATSRSSPRPGHGTAIRVTLPASRGTCTGTIRPGSDGEFRAAAASASSSSRTRPRVREIAVRLLSAAGYEVTGCRLTRGGAAAGAVCSRRPCC